MPDRRTPNPHARRGRTPLPALLLLAASLAACTVGPDHRVPDVPTGPGWTDPQVEAVPAVEPRAELERWWRSFGDPELDRLVERALDGNLDLRRAAARVAEARAVRAAVAGDDRPRVAARGSVERRRQSENGPLPIDRIQDLERDQTIYQAGFDAGWELDLFGRTARAVETADARLGAAVEEVRGVRTRVAAEVARTYLALRGTGSRLAARRDAVAAARRDLELVRLRVEVGETPAAALEVAERELRTLEARLPGLEAEIEGSALALGVLLGDLPESELPLAGDGGADPAAGAAEWSLAALPVGRRADLLRRRPDVRAAERRLAAATAEVGVATAELFPRLSIGAGGGFQALEAGDLLAAASQTFSVLPLVTWRIFDGGRVEAEIRASEARAEEAALAYEQAVLTALGDAERAMARYRGSLEALEGTGAAADAARRARDHAELRYRVGDSSLVELLDAERTLAESRAAEAARRTEAATDLVALFKALGGGWEGDGGEGAGLAPADGGRPASPGP